MIKLTGEKKVEKDDEEIINSLECDDIPNTRVLQEMRLKSVGKQTGHEEHIQKYYSEELKERLMKVPRIVILPIAEQTQIYSLAIPLSFPLCDFTGRDKEKIKTYFHRWTSWDCQVGAMHLTTQKGLEGLVKIFSKNFLSIKPEPAYGPIFGVSWQRDNLQAGLSVPHSWYVDTYDPGESLMRHQFVICEQDVIGIPYFFTIEQILEAREEQIGYNNTFIKRSHSQTRVKEAHCWATFYSSLHARKPQDYLQELLDERAKEEIGEGTFQGRVISSSWRTIRFGEPVTIYDPKWIDESL